MNYEFSHTVQNRGLWTISRPTTWEPPLRRHSHLNRAHSSSAVWPGAVSGIIKDCLLGRNSKFREFAADLPICEPVAASEDLKTTRPQSRGKARRRWIRCRPSAAVTTAETEKKVPQLFTCTRTTESVGSGRRPTAPRGGGRLGRTWPVSTCELQMTNSWQLARF